MNADWTKKSRPVRHRSGKAGYASVPGLPGKRKKSKMNCSPFSWLPRLQQNRKGSSSPAEEMDLIAEVLKSGKSPEETAQIDKMMHLMKMLKKQY